MPKAKTTIAEKGHTQVWAKVNAHVDEGILELIEALSSFPKLVTFESCEGGYKRSPSDNEGMPAMVFFHYGQHHQAHDYQEIADFVLGYLGPALERELGDLVSISLHIADYGIRGDLSVRPGSMPQTIKTLKRLRREFED